MAGYGDGNLIAIRVSGQHIEYNHVSHSDTLTADGLKYWRLVGCIDHNHNSFCITAAAITNFKAYFVVP